MIFFQRNFSPHISLKSFLQPSGSHKCVQLISHCRYNHSQVPKLANVFQFLVYDLIQVSRRMITDTIVNDRIIMPYCGNS
jgi:hypothetical protein